MRNCCGSNIWKIRLYTNFLIKKFFFFSWKTFLCLSGVVLEWRSRWGEAIDQLVTAATVNHTQSCSKTVKLRSQRHFTTFPNRSWSFLLKMATKKWQEKVSTSKTGNDIVEKKLKHYKHVVRRWWNGSHKDTRLVRQSESPWTLSVGWVEKKKRASKTRNRKCETMKNIRSFEGNKIIIRTSLFPG